MKNSNSNSNSTPNQPSIGVVIRFKNAARTLPDVLAALCAQTVRLDRVVAVDNQSTDKSADLLRTVGAEVIPWRRAYHHAEVLNFGLRHCPTDLVVVLSSHTVLKSPDALERLVAAMADPRTACASCRWDGDGFYSDSISWAELKQKGLKFASIYSNSMGIIRRSLWEQVPFDESLPTLEDGAWALEQLRRGYLCRRLDVPFSYQRGGPGRDFIFALLTFQLAARHELKVAWLGALTTLRTLARVGIDSCTGQRPAVRNPQALWERFRAWTAWRFVQVSQE